MLVSSGVFTEISFKRARIKLILLAIIQLKCAEQNSRLIGTARALFQFAVNFERRAHRCSGELCAICRHAKQTEGTAKEILNK